MENKRNDILLLRNKTLRLRFIVILTAFVVSILCLWFVYQKTIFSHIGQSEGETIALAESSLLLELDDEFSRMATVSYALSGSAYVQDFLAEKDVAIYYEKAEAVSEIIRKTAYPHNNTDSIITITAEGSYFRFTGSISDSAIGMIHNEIMNNRALSYSIMELDGTDYFCLVSSVYPRDPVIVQPVGYVITLSNTAKTRRALMRLNTVSGIDTAVILDDVILLSSNPELDGKHVSELDQLYGSVTVSQVTGSNLYAAIAISKNTLNFAERLFFTVSASALLVLLVTLAALYRLLSSKMVGPMLYKTEAMQIGLLKTQISDHFVVNTIDCIESLAEQGETQKTAIAARNLSGILRNLHEADEEINIYEQLSNLNYYIEIMNIRRGGKYVVDFDVCDVLVEYRIPAHILQPLVENAMIHGMGNKATDCRLIITGILNQDAIILEVSDNGIGMEQETIRALQKRLDNADEWDYDDYRLSGVALVNIQKRIRARYGKKYGLTARGALGEGMTFTVRLPMIEDR